MSIRFRTQPHYPNVGEVTITAEVSVSIVVPAPFTQEDADKERDAAYRKIAAQLRQLAAEIDAPLRCDECGERDTSVRYVDNAKRTANVCRKCQP